MGQASSISVSIIAVGRQSKASPEATMLQTYIGRIPWAVSVIEIEAKKARTDVQKFAEENEKMRAAIPAGAYVIALDSRGKACSSEDLSRTVQSARDDGIRTICFLIGGADGLDEQTLKRAQKKISFGAMIWPHMLARVMLTEQLFRAYCIQTNHPYHRASGQKPA